MANKKYPFGGYVESWSETSDKLRKARAKASLEVLDDKIINLLNITGAMSIAYGQNLFNKGVSMLPVGNITGNFKEPNGPNLNVNYSLPEIYSFVSELAKFGGIIGNKNVEVEGGEVIETPDGTTFKVKGPNHEKGGVKMNLPEFTEIFSKRLKDVDGKTFAKKKEERAKKLKKIENKLKKNPEDKLLKETYERLKKEYDDLDKKDLEKMSFLKMIIESTGQSDKFASGGQVLTYGKNILNDIFSNLPNLIGYYGMYKQALNAEKSTLENQLNSKPNINTFENFGKETLKKIDEMKELALRNKLLSDTTIQNTANATRNSLRNSARSVNTLRALDNSVYSKEQDAKLKNELSYSQMLNNILGKEADTLMNIDKVVMQAEDVKNVRDQQDIDNYYTQLGKAKAQKWEALMKAAYLLNKQKNIKNKQTTLNSIYSNFDYDYRTGKINFKSEEQLNSFEGWTGLPDDMKSTILDGALKGLYQFDTNINAWVDMDGNIIYKFE